MDLISVFQTISYLSVVKFLIVTLFVVYAIFALLMMSQVKAMIKAVTMRDDYVISTLGILNFVFAIVVLLLSIFIL